MKRKPNKIKDRIRTTMTCKELFPDDSNEGDLKNRPQRYWMNKNEDLRENFNQKRAELDKALQKA